MKDSLNNANQQANVNNPLTDEVQRPAEAKMDPEVVQAQLITANIKKKLEAFKQNLIPKLDQDHSELSLEVALAAVPTDEQLQQNVKAENLDWPALNQAQSRLTIEENSLKESILQLEKQVSELDLALAELKRQQEQELIRDSEESSSASWYKKIAKQIRSIFSTSQESSQQLVEKNYQTEKEQLNEELQKLESQLESIEDANIKLDQYSATQATFYLEEDIQQVVEAWRKPIQNVENSAWIRQEITQEYIDTEILTKLEAQVGENFSKQDVDKFMKNLTKYIDARNAGNDDKQQEARAEMEKNTSAFYAVDSQLQSIYQKEDLKIIQALLMDLAYDQEGEVQQAFLENLPDQIRNKLIPYLSKHLQPGYNRYGNWQVDEFIDQVDLGYFNAVKKSKTAQATYASLIKSFDDQIYTILMDQSLSDTEGGYIDKLVHYPTPNTIKNLVIIAATDNDQVGYRLIHANAALKRLAQRTDWPELLEQAVQSYPELSQIRELLLNWDFAEYENYPNIKETSSQLAKRIYDDKSEDDRLRTMARNSLTNDTLVAETFTKGILSQEDVLAYQRASNLVLTLSQVDDDNLESIIEAHEIRMNLLNWEDIFRNILKNLNNADPQSDKYLDLLTNLRTFLYLTELWEKNQDNPKKLSFLTSYDFIGIVGSCGGKHSVSIEDLNFLADAYDSYPCLNNNKNWRKFQFFQHKLPYFFNKSGMDFYQKFDDKYGDSTQASNAEALVKILSSVVDGKLSKNNALNFYEHAPKLLNKDHLILISSPKFDFVSDEGLQFLTKFYQTCLENNSDQEISMEVLQAVGQGQIQPELSYDYIKILPHLFNKDQASLRLFIFNHGKDIANNAEDLKFLSRFIGIHGKKTLTILDEYVICIKAGIITSENRNKILNFTQKFRVLSPTIAEGYLKAEARNLEEAYVAELQQLGSQMISSEPIPEQDRQKLFYNDLLKAVYPNNAGNWGGLAKTKACVDRTADLTQFTYDQKYEIDLLAAAKIKVKEGEVINEPAIESLKKPILTLAEEMKASSFDLEKIQTELEEKVDALLENKLAAGGLKNLDLKQLNTLDEKMFILLADSVYTDKTVPHQELKDLILRYEFALFEDVRDYIQGTTDRVSQASNQEYALMCELHSFFTDRIKEVNRRLVKAGWENQVLKERMQEYFAKIVQEQAQAKLSDQSNRFRLDRLGMSDSFIAQISRTIEKRMGKKYPPETIKKLILYYENLTQGLSVDSTSEKSSTRAFYGQVKAQRTKTMEAVETLTGNSLNLQEFRLGDTSLEDLALSLAKIDTGEYDEEQFQALTALRFVNLFADEQNLLETELAKFESESGKQRQVINGFFSKTKESANARMVGGVCVSQDNPLANQSPEQQKPNMWDSENYFQLVLQDPDTNRCLGLVLLHHFEEKGEKVLSASLNPSSTFLYSTDEASMFNGLMKVLETFAKNNGFNKILLSKNGAIRTNRTGGKFEKAMDERVRQINKAFSFEEEKIFSYSPNYKLKDMNIVWEQQ
ncbi:MAG: hypothetical protein GX559_03240 [Candidatus Pacebacteria bacterium]|nr:hypothetical protein [Candidatus Paceibacterota bacterium]